MTIDDILLYKEALSACGWSVIRTDELEELRDAKEEARYAITQEILYPRTGRKYFDTWLARHPKDKGEEEEQK